MSNPPIPNTPTRPYTINESTRVTRTQLRAEWDRERAAAYEALLQMAATGSRPEAMRIVNSLEQMHERITRALRDNWLQEAQRAHVMGYVAGTVAGTWADPPPPNLPTATPDEPPTEGEKGPIH